MKNIIILFTLLFSVIELFGQIGEMVIISDNEQAITKIASRQAIPFSRDYSARRVIDTSELNVTYTYSYLVDDNEGERFEDTQLLEIGDKVNRFYSLLGELRDSLSFEFTHDHSENDYGRGAGYSDRYSLDYKENESPIYRDIFTYHVSSELVVSERFKQTDYQYRESVDGIQWQILPQSDIIIGYNCQKAMIEFRGRTWYAWFTTEIPFAYGPWKLGGLPGLILKAEDSSGAFRWSAIAISKPKNYPIYRHNSEGKPSNHRVQKSSRREVAKLWRTSWLLPGTMMEPEGWILSVNVNGKEYDPKTMRSHRTYYPQLELE